MGRHESQEEFMAIKRKAGTRGAKAAKAQKRSSARPVAAKKKVLAAKSKPAPKSKITKPVKLVKPVKAVKPAKPVKLAKPEKNEKPAKVVAVKTKAPKPAPVVRPIGALPPEAVARAVQKAPPPPPPNKVTRPAVVKTSRETSQGGASGVTEKDYKEFEQRLLGERQKILKEMGHLENTVLKVNQRDSAGDLSGYSFHMADVGTDAMEREKAFMFASNEGALLKEIDEALRKVYRGEFGMCENCGRSIARARLEAMPYARLCLECKELEERAGRGAS
jgi:RNA polymerase-binding transcription factor